MKTLQFITCSLLLSGVVLWQPLKAQEQHISFDQPATQASAAATGSSSFAVTLIRYEARYSPVQRHVFINWQTIGEPNNQRFEVERSSNGQSFLKVGTLQGNPNSSSIRYYQFTDTAPLQGSSYYRLKQISTDSSFSYSNVLTVNTRLQHNPAVVTMAPNPCAGGNCEVRISQATPGQPVTLELLDQNSRVVLSRNLPAGSEATQLTSHDVAGLKGMYFLRVHSGSETTVTRVFLR